MAAKMPVAHREQLLDIARRWESLAEKRERRPASEDRSCDAGSGPN